MDRRYDVLSRNGCQHVRALNKKLAKAGEEQMPYIMVVVDELAAAAKRASSSASAEPTGRGSVKRLPGAICGSCMSRQRRGGF